MRESDSRVRDWSQHHCQRGGTRVGAASRSAGCVVAASPSIQRGGRTATSNYLHDVATISYSGTHFNWGDSQLGFGSRAG